MLAGRKLLLVDDSATIQKVIDLTFTDEGVHVVSVNNGAEAIERLDEVSPDIVLADVFMPGMTGYEVCDYIKHREKLRHIPVMLLVGSFEPFDEEEARRVGADDIVSKPFQSIRRLIDKVGALVSGAQAEEESTSVDSPKNEEAAGDTEEMSKFELEMSTADTLPLPDEAHPSIDETPQTSLDETMETYPPADLATRTSADTDDLLLDLGDLEPPLSVDAEESILDIDIEHPISAFAAAGVERGSYVEPELTQYAQTVGERHVVTGATAAAGSELSVGAGVVSMGIQEATGEGQVRSEPAPMKYETVEAAAPTVSSGKIGLNQLSPEVIDMIARRAVEQLSERVIQEIAWEVVPQLAELIITRQLQKGESQAK